MGMSIQEGTTLSVHKTNGQTRVKLLIMGYPHAVACNPLKVNTITLLGQIKFLERISYRLMSHDFIQKITLAYSFPSGLC